MIFIANVLTMNGGTTFLIRVCREFRRRGTKVVVLVLFPFFDATLRDELARYAKVIDLRDYLWERGIFFRAQLMSFAPVRWNKLLSDLSSYGNTVHVMGVFGLLFACRASCQNPLLRITAGVYHQNEFLFKARSSFFITTFRRCFDSLSQKQIIFFSQATIANYSKFYERDFSLSVLAPIGIVLPTNANKFRRNAIPTRLVSIGNLVNFKTYNRHIIEVVARLADKYPALQYEIYGVGPEENSLRNLTHQLHLEDRVQFMGQVAYSEFAMKLNSATLFIGSGTALLEAAAMGVPAIVGIESMQKPETYGFLSSIKGFSYNEYIPGIPVVQMCELIDNFLSDADYAENVSKNCIKKAAEFSVEFTVNGLETLTNNASVSSTSLKPVHTVLLFMSFACIAIGDRLGFSSTFRNRRDQSF
jgi:glycosyltransferase involved in cell wall biosynthesis